MTDPPNPNGRVDRYLDFGGLPYLLGITIRSVSVVVVVWISWKLGSLRSAGALGSPVQQHETVRRAVAEATNAVMMRIMMI